MARMCDIAIEQSRRVLNKTEQQGPARSTAGSLMSATVVGAGESVSRQCLRGRRVPSGYVEALNEARRLLADLFSVLLKLDLDVGFVFQVGHPDLVLILGLLLEDQ